MFLFHQRRHTPQSAELFSAARPRLHDIAIDRCRNSAGIDTGDRGGRKTDDRNRAAGLIRAVRLVVDDDPGLPFALRILFGVVEALKIGKGGLQLPTGKIKFIADLCSRYGVGVRRECIKNGL